jgi:exopolysaccharide biosynthesis protein
VRQKILPLLLTVAFLLSIVVFLQRDDVSLNTSEDKQDSSVLDYKTEDGGSDKTIAFGDETYAYDLFVVEDAADIRLIPNFKEKKTSEMTIKEYGCSALTSAGFYSEEGEPIGLFIHDFKKLSDFEKNNTFNGFFWINYLDTPLITRTVEQEQARLAIQTGPILMENKEVINLSLKNDKRARRVVAATTGENSVVFLAVYDEQSKLRGPLLDSLPEIMEKISQTNNLNIADAINLDGGSASAFLSADDNLVESVWVGGLFCIKD